MHKCPAAEPGAPAQRASWWRGYFDFHWRPKYGRRGFSKEQGLKSTLEVLENEAFVTDLLGATKQLFCEMVELLQAFEKTQAVSLLYHSKDCLKSLLLIGPPWTALRNNPDQGHIKQLLTAYDTAFKFCRVCFKTARPFLTSSPQVCYNILTGSQLLGVP